MKIKTTNEAPQVATLVNLQKQAYKSPLLRVYGAVHQFTQGTGAQGSDGGTTMTMMA